MSFERSTGSGAGLGAEPAPTPGPGGLEGPGEGGVTPAMRLQILSTEHWSLLASRSLAWNESFSAYAGREISRSRSELTPMFPTGEAPPA